MADYYALDDTLVGRLIQAGFVGALIAVPDAVPAGGGRRTLTRLGVAAAGVATAALANLVDEEPDHEGPDRDDPAQLVQDLGADSVTKTWAALGVGLVAASLGNALAARGATAVAGRLRSRGVDKPYLVLGALAAGGVFAASQIQDNDTAHRSIHV